MLQFSANLFFWCGHFLAEIQANCVLGSIPGTGEERIFNLSLPLDDTARNKALDGLKRVEQEFRKIGLQITADTVGEIVQTLEGSTWQKQTFQWLMDQL